MSTATEERTDILEEVKDSIPCEAAMPSTCPNPGEWINIACANGHPVFPHSTDTLGAVCNDHKNSLTIESQMFGDHIKSMFACPTCGGDIVIPFQWRHV